MDQLTKNKLVLITIFLDIVLLCALFFYTFETFDSFWIISVFISHLLFYYNLIFYNRYILDILHYFVFILPSLSLFAKNIVIKILSLVLLILIQVLWVLENRCILNEKDSKFGYGNELNYYLLLLTPILSFNIGHNVGYNYLSNNNIS
jgi:hypothetical protein